MDIQDEIDRSFGAGPEPGPVDALVADGRRALRRRRATTGAAALAIVLVAGGTTWAVAGPGTQAGGDDRPVASDTSPGPGEEEPPATAHQSPATLDQDGTLVLRDGVTVLRRVDDPMHLEPPKRSVGLVLDDHGKQVWMLIESDPAGGFSVLDDSHEAETTFDRWLREAVSENQPGATTATEEAPAHYAGDGRLVIRRDVTVVRRVDNPLGLAPPLDSVGLVLDVGGTREWMLLRTNSNGSTSTMDEAGASAPTFDRWLAGQVALNTGPILSHLVFLGEGETIVAPDVSVQINDQRPSPRLPAGFARPGDRTAVAWLLYEGTYWFVLARQVPGSQPELFFTRASEADDATSIDEFLDWARVKYADGEGLR